MNDTNMNEIQKHYLEKSKEARKILDTIPIPAQMRTKAKVITNDKFEPVVAVECDFKAVDINNLHSVIAYDKEQRRWMDAVYIPEQADPERYVVYAPDDWQLTSFLQVRIDTVIDHFNRKGKQPQDSFTAHVFVGEWETHKDDNLISIIHLFDMWWANLSLEFVQTGDASKAVFYAKALYNYWAAYYPIRTSDTQEALVDYIHNCLVMENCLINNDDGLLVDCNNDLVQSFVRLKATGDDWEDDFADWYADTILKPL